MLIQRAKRPTNYPISVPAPSPRKRSLELMGMWYALLEISPHPDEDVPITTDEEFCEQFGIGRRKYLRLIKEAAADWPWLLTNLEHDFRDHERPFPTIGPAARFAAAVKKLNS